MSLSLLLKSNECLTCGHFESTESLNYTYNVSPMWYEIYPKQDHMVDVDGLTGKESLSLLECALQMLESSPSKFIAMNPENGWGSYEGFKKYITELILIAKEHPDWVWQSCR